MNILGIDIGGSNMKSAVVTERGECLDIQEKQTSRHFDQILLDLENIISGHKGLAGLGICVPGLVDEKKGVIKQVVNIHGLDSCKIFAELKILDTNLTYPTALINDADAALLGESWLGAAKDYQSVVMLTLGTGVGGAVMINGMLLKHPDSLDKEIGHWQVDADDKFACNAGVAGSIEAKIGGYCVRQRYQQTLEALAKKTRAGDDLAKNHFADISYWFHAILEHADNKFHPDIFVIGGSAAKSLDLFLADVEPIKPVVKAKLGNQAGVIGVAKKVLDSF